MKKIYYVYPGKRVICEYDVVYETKSSIAYTKNDDDSIYITTKEVIRYDANFSKDVFYFWAYTFIFASRELAEEFLENYETARQVYTYKENIKQADNSINSIKDRIIELNKKITQLESEILREKETLNND